MNNNDYIRALKENKTKNYFYERAKELGEKFDIDAKVSDGVVRWNSNNEVPPKEVLELWQYLEKPFDYEKSLKVLKEERDAFLDEYRKRMANHVPSQEELYEMTAAFGPSAKVVNVFAPENVIQLPSSSNKKFTMKRNEE